MDTGVKTLELPISLYNKLQALAAEEQLEPVEMLTQWAEPLLLWNCRLNYMIGGNIAYGNH
jgi:hypothetical protein